MWIYTNVYTATDIIHNIIPLKSKLSRLIFPVSER